MSDNLTDILARMAESYAASEKLINEWCAAILKDAAAPKPADEDFTDVKAAMFDFGVDKTAPAPDAKGDLWEVAIKDTYNSTVEVRADRVEFGPFAGHDIGFTAYLDGVEVFHAPADEYHYARKVTN